MYIPAVPFTAQNSAYIQRQKDCFLRGTPPPDFPQWGGEKGFVGVATTDHILGSRGREAMGFSIEVA